VVRRMAASLVVAGSVAASFLAAAPGQASGTAATPRWMLHIQRYPGGISNGVRAMVSPEAVAARAAAHRIARASASVSFGPNVQMNTDSSPPLPQNETAAAVSLANPKVAVAAANDYVSGGNIVMRTADGGRHWRSARVTPSFDGTGDVCSGGDPSVAYSRRDHVFYMGQLCFFRTLPFSEVQIYVSRDNGRTWTPGRAAARAATNFNYTTGKVNASIFNDKDYIAVDNTKSSPHYGRLYVGYTKFHMLPSGFSDYCPLQLSYTDSVNMANPTLTTFQHTAIQPDNPGGNGTGSSANQYFTPQVERNGALDVAFMSEDCNDSFDPHILFQRSTNGGQSFLPNAVRVDKPGQYMDFLDAAKDDTLPPTSFRAPNTPSLAYDPANGSLTFLYQNNINRAVSKADISYQRSTDGGQHWSNMRFLSVTKSGKPARNDQFFPWVAAASNGNLYAIWFDRRRDPANININTWEARSANGGVTWTSRRISTRSWNPNLGFFSSGAFIGDYNGIAVSSTNVYPVWTDGRNTAIARTGIGETNIFTDVEHR
jgi:BNR/Asp-box repeat